MNLIRAIIMGRARCKRCNDNRFVDYWWKQNGDFVLRKMSCPVCGDNTIEPVTITCKPIDAHPAKCPKCFSVDPWERKYWYQESVVACKHCHYILGD